MSHVVYDSFMPNLVDGAIDLHGGDVWVMLATNEYDPDADHSTTDDVSGECEGQGYRAGGKKLEGTKFQVYSDEAIFSADDVEWRDCTLAPQYAILYARKGGKLILCLDLGMEGGTRDGLFKIHWLEDGIFILPFTLFSHGMTS